MRGAGVERRGQMAMIGSGEGAGDEEKIAMATAASGAAHDGGAARCSTGGRKQVVGRMGTAGASMVARGAKRCRFDQKSFAVCSEARRARWAMG